MKKIFSFESLIIVLVVFFSISGLLNSSYFTVHDDQHIARLYLLDQAIKQGDLYPRWVGTLGFNFGYPLFNFYPPLIYYVAEFFHLIGLNLLWSLKMMIITGSFISSIGMYLLATRLFNKRAGLLAATLHTFFFYHIITLFVRGAWAEFFAMSILPFVFLGIHSLCSDKEYKFPILFSISICFLILAHPLIAFPAIFFIALFFLYYFILSTNRWQFFKKAFIGGLVGLGLSAFFWLPSLIEKQYTLVNTILTHELADYKLHFIYPFQLWFSAWGYGGSIVGPNDGITFQLGKIHIYFTLFSVIFCSIYVFLKRKGVSLVSYLFIAVLLLFSLFMSLTYSQFMWNKISYLWYLQFPWRFLTFTGIFLSIVAGAGIYFLEKIIPLNGKVKYISLNFFTILLVIITVYKYSTYSKPYGQKAYDEKYLTSTEEISWRVSNTSFEFSPNGIKIKKTKQSTTTIALEKKDIANEVYKLINVDKNDVKVSLLVNNFSKKEFQINAKNSFQLRLNTFNFPGWYALLNGKEIKINDNNNYKLITISVPPGKNKVTLVFGNTPVRIVGNVISIASLVILSYLYFVKRKEGKK